MDPVACADRFVSAALSGDMEEAKYALMDLTEWFFRGEANGVIKVAERKAAALIAERYVAV